MSNLYVQETFVNQSEGWSFGKSGVYETYTDDLGELYASMRSEYGRPTKMYRETANGDFRCGWVFSRQEKYEDSPQKYTREVWVTVYRQTEDGRLENAFTKGETRKNANPKK